MQTTVTYRGQLLTINLPSRDTYGRGATATVLRGAVVTGAGIQHFALKVYPMYPTHDELELLNREIDVWQKFNHPRILPFIGRCELGSHQVALVSPFMKNGNMCEYLKNNPSEDRLNLVTQVAEGLQYLHSKVRVVHGDIKGENVLISDDGTILLADFGLSTLVEATNNPTATHIRQRKTIRFSAPELFMDQATTSSDQVHILRSKTTFNDVFAFGMLIYQTYTDKPPWLGMHDVQVMTSILSGVCPPRPNDGDSGRRFCNATWALCEKCWAMDPTSRPSITGVVALLGRLRKIPRAQAGLNPFATEFRMTLPRTPGLKPSPASPPLNALAVPFSPRAPIIPTQLTAKVLRSTLNSDAAVFVPRAKPTVGSTPPRASGLDPTAVPFIPRSIPVPASHTDKDVLEGPTKRFQSPARVADSFIFPSTAEHLELVSPPSIPPAQPKLNHNAAVFVPRHPPTQRPTLNRNAVAFVPRRALPPPPLCTSLAPATPPLVESPRTPDLVPDLPSSAPSTPSTAHPTPTRGDSAVFNLDARPFVPRLRSSTTGTPTPAEDDKQETIRAMAYALIF